MRHYSVTPIVDTTHIHCPAIMAIRCEAQSTILQERLVFRCEPQGKIVDARNFSDSFAARSVITHCLKRDRRRSRDVLFFRGVKGG